MVLGRRILDKYEREDCESLGINRHYKEKRELYHGWARDCFGKEITEQLAFKSFEELEKTLMARNAGKVLGRSRTPLDKDFAALLNMHKAKGTHNENYMRDLMGMVAIEDGK